MSGREATVRLLSIRGTRSSDRCVPRHSLCTKCGKDLGYSGARDRVVSLLEQVCRVYRYILECCNVNRRDIYCI